MGSIPAAGMTSAQLILGVCVGVCVCEVLEMLEVLAASKVLGGFKVLGMLEMVCAMWGPRADICVEPGPLVISLFNSGS